jgi:regulator of RNase E activity RraA
MSLYAVKSNSAKKYKRRIGNSPIQVFASPIELIDINNEADLELAKVVASGILSKEEKNLKLLGKYLTSSLISDILDEFDVQSVLPNCYESNFSGAKLFGRARTLHIRKSKKSDSKNSIYEALAHYKEVVSNDIIVVRNDLPNFAYFGELNTTLALRSGASGALIGGVTRDSKETGKAHFPVFSKGSYCVDIKGRGAVESMNKSIKLDGIEINPSDLVFADKDGIVIIPRKIETEVIKSAIHKLKTEKNIITDIFNEIDVNQLVKKHGFF